MGCFFLMAFPVHVYLAQTAKDLSKAKEAVRQELERRGTSGDVILKGLKLLVDLEKTACEKAEVEFVYGTDYRKSPLL